MRACKESYCVVSQHDEERTVWTWQHVTTVPVSIILWREQQFHGEHLFSRVSFLLSSKVNYVFSSVYFWESHKISAMPSVKNDPTVLLWMIVYSRLMSQRSTAWSSTMWSHRMCLMLHGPNSDLFLLSCQYLKKQMELDIFRSDHMWKEILDTCQFDCHLNTQISISFLFWLVLHKMRHIILLYFIRVV